MAQNIAKNTTWFTGSLVLQKILSFIYFWYISNQLWPDDIGKYVFALSFTTLFSIFIDLGLSPILIRESAKLTNKSNDYLKNVLAIKIPLAVFTVLAAILVINFSQKSDLIKLLVYLACIVMVLDSFTLSFYSIFRSARNLKYESLGAIFFQVVNFILGITALKLTGRIQFIMLALVGSSLFNFCYSLILLKYKLKFSLLPQWQTETIKHILKILPAFAMAGIFVKIYNTSDSVLLGYLAGTRAVGFYAVPIKITSALQMLIAGSFTAAMFPAFCHAYAHAKEGLTKIYERAVFYLMILGVPLALGLFVLAPQIIKKLWPNYLPAASSFKIMALALPFIFIAYATGSLLNACDRQKNNTTNRVLVTILAVCLNLVLIPFFSQLGAAITYFCSSLILIFLDLRWIRNIIDYDKTYLLKTAGKIIISAVAMAIVCYLLLSINLIINIIVSVVIYSVAIFLTKALSLFDLKYLFNIIFKAKDEKSTFGDN